MTKPDAVPMTNIATDVIEGYKTGLAGGPMGFVSAAFDCGWLTGAHERAALSEQPAPKTACKGIPRVGCNYLAECDSVCNKCGKVHAVHLIPGVGSTAPVERVPLSDEQVLACIRSAKVGPVPMGMTRERGPYDVTEPTYFAQRFASAVIAEYERLNGISATPRQPLLPAQGKGGE